MRKKEGCVIPQQSSKSLSNLYDFALSRIQLDCCY